MTVPNELDLIELNLILAFPLDFARVVRHTVHIELRNAHQLLYLVGLLNIGFDASVAFEQLLFYTNEEEKHVLRHLKAVL